MDPELICQGLGEPGGSICRGRETHSTRTHTRAPMQEAQTEHLVKNFIQHELFSS